MAWGIGNIKTIYNFNYQISETVLEEPSKTISFRINSSSVPKLYYIVLGNKIVKDDQLTVNRSFDEIPSNTTIWETENDKYFISHLFVQDIIRQDSTIKVGNTEGVYEIRERNYNLGVVFSSSSTYTQDGYYRISLKDEEKRGVISPILTSYNNGILTITNNYSSSTAYSPGDAAKAYFLGDGHIAYTMYYVPYYENQENYVEIVVDPLNANTTKFSTGATQMYLRKPTGNWR